MKIIVEGKFGKDWRKVLVIPLPVLFSVTGPHEFRWVKWIGPFKATVIGRVRFEQE